MSFDYSEFIAFRDKFEKMTDEFDTFLKKFLVRQALEVLRKTKGSKHPVITGLLINSWTLSDVVRNGDNLSITISNNAEYASYVEYGHMDRGGKKWVDGQFLCTIPLKDIQGKIPQRFESAFETWFNNMMR